MIGHLFGVIYISDNLDLTGFDTTSSLLLPGLKLWRLTVAPNGCTIRIHCSAIPQPRQVQLGTSHVIDADFFVGFFVCCC